MSSGDAALTLLGIGFLIFVTVSIKGCEDTARFGQCVAKTQDPKLCMEVLK